MQTELAAWRRVTVDPESLEGLRRRTLWTLFAGVALGSTGYIAAVTVGTLVAEDLGGTEALAGMPSAIAVLGAATGASLLSAFMLRRGRRPGLVLGLGLAAIGAVLALVSVIVGSLLLLLAGSFLAGFGNAAGQLARYVAADMFSAERRGSALSIVVWGATLGAVTGPNLIAPAREVAEMFGLPALSGAYGVTLLFSLIGLVLAYLLLRPEPYALADASALSGDARGGEGRGTSVRTLLGRTNVLVALATLVAGQVVMVLIMTMTPLHIRAHGHGLETVGFVLSAHTFGMFALSPVSGRLTDRFGSPAVIGTGLVTLAAASLLAALAPADGGLVLTGALFLLGYGWNLGFVAGSAMLSRGLGLGERTRLQGVVDGLIWGSAAVASLGSGLVVAGASYAALGFLGLALLVGPSLLLAGRAPRLRPA